MASTQYDPLLFPRCSDSSFAPLCALPIPTSFFSPKSCAVLLPQDDDEAYRSAIAFGTPRKAANASWAAPRLKSGSGLGDSVEDTSMEQLLHLMRQEGL